MSEQIPEGVEIPAAPSIPERPAVDVMHGVEITDPYRQLESCDDEETMRWTGKHNERTERVMAQIPGHEWYRQRLSELLSGEQVGSPKRINGVLFFTRRRAGDNQPRLCYLRGNDEHELLNPNDEDPEGLVSLDWWYPSPDAKLVAYGYSSRGDEWSTLRVIDVQTREDLPLAIERARGASVAWERDGNGFYYTRYPDIGEVPAGEEYYNRRVFYHRLGNDPKQDPVVFGRGRPKEEMYQVKMCDNGRYLLLTANQGWARNEVYVRDELNGDELVPVITGKDGLFSGDIVDGTLYLFTNYQAPRYRIVAQKLTAGKNTDWNEIVPEQENLVLKDMQICGGRLVITGLDDAVYRLFTCKLDGSDWREITLPFKGTISELSTDTEGINFTLQSFLHAPAIYGAETESEAPEPIRKGTQPVDISDYVSEQIFYESRDGTTIPMFVVRHVETQLSEPRPTLLTGYGGFNISRTPVFSPAQIPWMENGGIFALANLRGGSEYGEDWHRAGMLENKQNVFDDFIAAAEFLIEQEYTQPALLGIMGGSNGGLLVGAALTQRPDLFGAVVCGVPLLDMLRFHKFLIAGIWTSEYGSPDDREQFAWLYDYSPYHHVREGEIYPAVYLHTALSDSRVHPMHARKMAARLQSATASDRPVLLHVESDAGHGAGKPVDKVVDSQARILTFIDHELGLSE